MKSVQAGDIPIDSPTITFKDNSLLFKQCKEYLGALGVTDTTINKAFSLAMSVQDNYVRDIISYNERVLAKARERGALAILLAGRPYHADMLIQHKVSDMLADMGIYVITDDIVRDKKVAVNDAHYLSQWAYPNRILEAAKWCAGQDGMEFVQMTSFGCGPDAFLVDEVRDLLLRHGRVLTLLKLDDINNVGSMKLRVRSLIESLKLAVLRRCRPPQDGRVQDYARVRQGLPWQENPCSVLYPVHFAAHSGHHACGRIRRGEPSVERHRVVRMGLEICQQRSMLPRDADRRRHNQGVQKR